jgi:hypothetical protein
MGKRMNLSFKETGRMTVRMFNKFYEHYENTWDFEMRLSKANITHEEAFVKSQKEEEWF